MVKPWDMALCAIKRCAFGTILTHLPTKRLGDSILRKRKAMPVVEMEAALGAK